MAPCACKAWHRSTTQAGSARSRRSRPGRRIAPPCGREHGALAVGVRSVITGRGPAPGRLTSGDALDHPMRPEQVFHQRLLHVHAVLGPSHTTDCGPSMTSAATSSPRWAGRQCMKSASGLRHPSWRYRHTSWRTPPAGFVLGLVAHAGPDVSRNEVWRRRRPPSGSQKVFRQAGVLTPGDPGSIS